MYAFPDFFADGYPESEMIAAVMEHVYHEIAVPILTAFLISALELPSLFEFFGVMHDLVDIQIFSPRRVAPAKVTVELQICQD